LFELTGQRLQDLDHFKLINEAYSVLADPVLRRDYDSQGDTKFNRLAALRRKNEGVLDPRTGMQSAFQAVSLLPQTHSNVCADAVPSIELSEEDRFRRAMARATERHKDSAKFRASLQRLNRAQVRFSHLLGDIQLF
jgi:DnaJ-class molecular chaperone